MIYLSKIQTQLGEMTAGATDEGLCLFDFTYRKMMPSILKRIQLHLNNEIIQQHHHLFDELKIQIEEYFQRKRESFSLPLIFTGSDFQKQVWNELLKIPYGETRSYKQQAIAIGNLDAIRAVASANGQNCFAIIVPCHRVIAENGDLTGYAGGISKKKWLLDFESEVKSGQGKLF